MADVFISYSRRDQAFARKLHAVFESLKREACFDWNDIPPSVKFLEEIYQRIDAANTFIFVLRPVSHYF